MLADASSVLVTGGAGFVGSALVEELLGRAGRARIHVLDNLFNGRREFVPESPRVALHAADLADEAAVAAAVAEARPEVVFHLAALHYIPYCNAHPAETMRVNVVGTQCLLEALRRHEPRALVAASTVAVYPIRDEPNAEDDPAGPVDIYGLSKWVNERQVELFSRQVRARCAVARLSNVYGPRETNPHVIPEILDQLADGRGAVALGNVKPKRDYIYVTDVARGLLAIADGNDRPYRTYNLGTGEEHSVEEIVAHLSRIAGRPIQIDVAADRVRASDRMHLVSDIGRISRELGWRPEHTIETGLADLARRVGLADADTGTREPALT
jgi:UDP-glucose 4-epimerase